MYIYIYMIEELYFILVEVPGVARRTFYFNFKEKNRFLKKKVEICLSYVTHRAPIGSLNKFQPIRSSRLASYS